MATLGLKLPTTKLNTGATLPLIGFGTWRSKTADQNVYDAIKLGYRHLDLATAYGNQDKVGDGLERAYKEGLVKREDLFITSKLWNEEHSEVETALKRVLDNLGPSTKYLDLYLMHWPVAMNEGPKVDPPLHETYKAMEEQVKAGRTKAIGVSNFSIKKLEDLISKTSIKPAVNQVEVHPYWRNQKVVDWCLSHDIHVTAYSPLGSQTPEGKTSPLQDDTINRIAKKYGKSPAQICLKWGLQHGTSVIPKTTSARRAKENLASLDFELSKEDFDAISFIPTQRRSVGASMWTSDKGPYKTAADLWDEPDADKYE